MDERCDDAISTGEIVSIEAFRAYVSPYIPGCPFFLIDREVTRVLRELCEKAKLWKESVEVTSLHKNSNKIDIGPYPEAEVIYVEYVTYRGLELASTTERTLSRDFPRWRDIKGVPIYYFMSAKDSAIYLYPIPNLLAPLTIKYEVIVKPSLDAKCVPRFLFERFIDAVVDGALYGLMAIGGKEWSNPEEAARRQQLYFAGIYRARDLSTRMYASQNLEITPAKIY